MTKYKLYHIKVLVMCRHEGNVSKTTGCTEVIMETVLDTNRPASITLCLYKIHFRRIFKSSVTHTHTHTSDGTDVPLF